VRLMLWDTAGQEEFDAITKAYYRGAQACVLAFSTTDRDSFEAAHSWKMKVQTQDPLFLSPEGTGCDKWGGGGIFDRLSGGCKTYRPTRNVNFVKFRCIFIIN
jgi:hypothetical protein